VHPRRDLGEPWLGHHRTSGSRWLRCPQDALACLAGKQLPTGGDVRDESFRHGLAGEWVIPPFKPCLVYRPWFQAIPEKHRGHHENRRMAPGERVPQTRHHQPPGSWHRPV